MPTYVYRCTGCMHQWELVQSMRDDAIQICPECKKPRANRLLQAVNVAPSATPTRMNKVAPKPAQPVWEKGRAGERRVDGSFAPYRRPADQTPMGVKEFADNRTKYEKHLRKVRSGNSD